MSCSVTIPSDSYVLCVDESGPKDLVSPHGDCLHAGGVLVAAADVNDVITAFQRLKLETFGEHVVFHAYPFFEGEQLVPGAPAWPDTAAHAFMSGVVEWLRHTLVTLVGVRVEKRRWLDQHPDVVERLAQAAGLPLAEARDVVAALKDRTFARSVGKGVAKIVQHYGYFAAIQAAAQLACRTIDRNGVAPTSECLVVADEIEPGLCDTHRRSLKGMTGEWLRSLKRSHRRAFARVVRPPTFLPDEELELLQLADLVAFLVGDDFETQQHVDL
ncbi:MAG: hypothetical protein KC503_10350 [Myxococcales bacterium]|nr:hypothetical protein [Myxococcales bacterium]